MEPAVGSPDRYVDGGDFPPSHPNFNRGGLSDGEFCERLLFENRELHQDIRHKSDQLSMISKQHDDTIRLLRQQLQEKESLIVSLQELLRESISHSTKFDKQKAKPSSPKQPDSFDSSALSSDNSSNQNLPTSNSVSGSSDLASLGDSKGTPRLGGNLSKEGLKISTDVANDTTKDSPSTKGSTQSPSSSTIATPVIPLRSTRRRKNSTSENDAKPNHHDIPVIEEPEQRPLENPKVRSKLETTETPKSTQSSRFERSTPRSGDSESFPEKVTSTPRLGSLPEKSTPRQLDALSEKLSRKISESSVIANVKSTTNNNSKSPDVDTKAGTFEDNRTNVLQNSRTNSSSNGSMQTYKSRIKLPSATKKPLDLQEYQLERERTKAEIQSKQLQNENEAFNDAKNSLLSKEKPETDTSKLKKDDKLNENKPDLTISTSLPSKYQRSKESLPKPGVLDTRNEVSTQLKSSADFNRSLDKIGASPSEGSLQYNSDNFYAPKTPDAISRKFFDVETANEKTSAFNSPVNNNLSVSKVYTGSNNNSTSSLSKPSRHSNSSFHVLPSPKPEDEPVLFVKPEDFHTIYLNVVSTISVKAPNQSSRNSDPSCVISIHDKESNKEMWRIRKTYSQILAFDNEIRPIVEYFGLPNIPERQLFFSTTPSKVDQRRSNLQNYFNSIALLPHIPQMVLLRICRYLSLDFVNPLDDFKSGSRKEGFLLRRYKGLGTSWKVRWCQVDGSTLEIYETPGGPQIEEVNLRGAQIGRQNTDSVAEDKGYRHAFLIMEDKTSKLSSSSNKHFFCAETDEQRDEWVDVLLEYNDPHAGFNGSTSQVDLSSTLNSHNPYDTNELEDTIHKNATNTSINTGGSGYSNHEEDEEREIKKNKKKSIFPFSRNRHIEPEENTTMANVKPDTSMQQYIDQLKLEDETTDSIFGRDLLEAFKLSNHFYENRAIPSICYRCLDYLVKTGAIYEEGIFRLSGSASTIRQLKDQFNTHFDLDLFESNLKPDIHTVSGLLKTYLRELPSPILGQNCYQHLNNVILHNNLSAASTATIFRDYFNDPANVDVVHYNTCYTIFKLLTHIIANSQSNRMNLRNVCIVFVPTLNISLEVLSIFLIDFSCIFENGSPVPDHKREVLDLHIPNF